MAAVKGMKRKKGTPYDVMNDPRIIKICLTCPKKECLEWCKRFNQARREVLKNG